MEENQKLKINELLQTKKNMYIFFNINSSYYYYFFFLLILIILYFIIM